jgi:hypothetical protein
MVVAMAAPRKSPVGAIAFWFVTVCAVAALSNFTGRYTGWATRLAGGEAPASSRLSPDTSGNEGADVASTHGPSAPRTPVREVAGTATEVVDETGTVKDVFTAGEFKPVAVQETTEARSEAEEQFDALYKKFLARLKPPEIGKQYTFRLSKGGSVSGVLESLSPGAVSVRMEYGAITYPIHRIHESSQALLFPQRAAKMAALRELNRVRLEAERAEARKLADAQAKAAAAAARDREQAVAAARAEQSLPQTQPPAPEIQPTVQLPPSPARPDISGLPPARGDLNYDPSPGTTPDHLKGPLTAFANWLQVQQRRMGGKLANKVYAKQPDRGRIVLYLQMHENFMVQDYDWRFQISEGMWRIWALRGVDSGLINGPNHGHVVLLGSDGRIIGGSSPEDGSNVWAERKL